MNKKKWTAVILVLSAMVIAVLALQHRNSSDWFVEYPLPLIEEYQHRLFDIGIVDANQDNLLDIYTSNHNFRQTLLIADGRGGYRDALDEWGLNQIKEFPGVELSYTAPRINKAGLYIYWLGRGGNDEFGHNLVIRAHKIEEIGHWQGTLQVLAPVEVAENDGINVEIQPKSPTSPGTVVNFSATGDGLLALKLKTWGLPLNFDLKSPIQPSQIYVGNQNVSPRSTSFSLALQDRHGLAWADYNDDGRLDVFMTRGAIGGTLKQLPKNVRNTITDHFFVSEEDGRYQDIASKIGIVKENCSGRGVKWVDFNHDGLLDLFINCQDRGRVEEDFPKQLYRQNGKGQFVNTAAEAGLDIPDHQLIDFKWLDADNDGDADLLTSEDKGFFLYRNQAGRFSPEFMGRGEFARGDKPGLKYVSTDYWDFDGKLTVADYDGDGDLDAFSVSKRGNTLLVNNNGVYSPVDPASVGLPNASVGGNWVDYDNDGLTDFHAVPEGLFRQRKDHKFDTTNLLVFPSRRYMGALSNWADLDNDGTRDVVIALNENPSLWRWWEKPFKRPKDLFKWKFLAYRNVGAVNHWLEIKLTGAAGNRQAIGARVTIVTPDSQQTQEVGINEGAAYSQGHYRLYFGLGPNKRVDTVKIRWPDGHQQELKNIAGDSLLAVKRKSES